MVQSQTPEAESLQSAKVCGVSTAAALVLGLGAGLCLSLEGSVPWFLVSSWEPLMRPLRCSLG